MSVIICIQLCCPHIQYCRCRPMIFTMWEPYVYYEGVELINTIHMHPAILIIRPRITTYHGKNTNNIKLMLLTFNLNEYN